MRRKKQGKGVEKEKEIERERKRKRVRGEVFPRSSKGPFETKALRSNTDPEVPVYTGSPAGYFLHPSMRKEWTRILLPPQAHRAEGERWAGCVEKGEEGLVTVGVRSVWPLRLGVASYGGNGVPGTAT